MKTTTEWVEEAALDGPAGGVSQRDLRHALGAYTTGVAVITTLGAGNKPVGITVNSFASLSLSPPLILWSLNAQSPSRKYFDAATHFAVNVLSEAQVALSRRFASRIPQKFVDVATHPGLGGAPVLDECAAVFECRLQSRNPGGDHIVYIGEVENYLVYPERPPLLFHQGRYRRIGPVIE